MFLCLFLVGLVSAGTVYNDDETFNVTKTDNGKNGTTDIYGYLDFNPNFKFQIERISDEVYEITLIRTNETKETNSSGGVSFLNKKNVSKDFVIVGNEDQTSYEVEDPVIETPSKPDGSTCLVQWVCENGAWIKTDYVNWHIPYNCEKDKMIYNSYSNKMVKSQYNERNCEHSKNYWKKVIPGEKCFVLNDNGIGLKSKPTTACQSETIVLNEPKSTEKIDIIIEKPKPKSLWQRIISWFK